MFLVFLANEHKYLHVDSPSRRSESRPWVHCRQRVTQDRVLRAAPNIPYASETFFFLFYYVTILVSHCWAKAYRLA